MFEVSPLALLSWLSPTHCVHEVIKQEGYLWWTCNRHLETYRFFIRQALLKTYIHSFCHTSVLHPTSASCQIQQPLLGPIYTRCGVYRYLIRQALAVGDLNTLVQAYILLFNKQRLSNGRWQVWSSVVGIWIHHWSMSEH